MAKKSESTDFLSTFRNLSLCQKTTLQKCSKDDEKPYILHMATQPNFQNSKVATACTDRDIRIFSRDSLVLDAKLSGHVDVITDIGFGKTDPNLLYSCSNDQTVRCWDLREKDGKEVQQLEVPPQGEFEFLCVDSSHSDIMLCAGSEYFDGQDTHLMFWDRRANKCLGTYTESHDDSITRVAFKSGSDTLLTSGGADGIVCVFDIKNSSEEDALQMTFNVESCVEKLGWCGDPQSNMYCLTSDHKFYAWDALEGDDKCFIPRESIIKDNEREYIVDCVPAHTTSSAQGNEALILTGNYSGVLSFLWRSSDGSDTVLSPLSKGHVETVRCLHWDPQTKTLLTGGEDSCLCLWSAPLDPSIPKSLGKIKIDRSQTKKKPYQRKS